jgi:hypothetical protein
VVEHLDIDVFRRDSAAKPEKHEYKVRIREVLWKPTMPKQRLGTYLGLVWLWAFAFRSHNLRKTRLEEHDKRARERRRDAVQGSAQAGQDNNEWRTDWDENGLKIIEEKLRGKRSCLDFRGRIVLAVLGLLSTVLWAWVGAEIMKKWWEVRPPQDPNLTALRLWQVATSVISVSLLAAVLLLLLAWKERRDREATDSRGERTPKEHGRLHLIAMVTTTAWLAIFLAPVLLLFYYWDRVLVAALVLLLGGWVLWASLRFDWWLRLLFLLAVAGLGWVVLQRIMREELSRRVAVSGRDNRRKPLTQWLSTLLIAAGAPWVIFLISVLEVLSILPLGGHTFNRWAQTIAEASYWNALKDIHMFLTDSSRSALVRSLVMEGIEKLNKEVDSIHIFAHSLGTVVAYDTLVHLGTGQAACVDQKGATARLGVDAVPVSIDQLCLPARVVRILKDAGIDTVEQLCEKDEEALLAIRGLGPKSLEEVRGCLKTTDAGAELRRKIKTLVTYGSPLNKIGILAESPAAKREARCGLDDWRFDSRARLPHDLGCGDFRWINIYALEDAASDVCSKYSGQDDLLRPYEFSAWGAKDLVTAHGAYFTDPGFWNTALEAMGVVYNGEEMRRIEKVLIEEKDLEALRGAGVVTQWQLLERGATPGLRKTLKEETQISSDMILRYANLSELVRVPGIDEETADLLTLAGVGTLQGLKGENAADLHETLKAYKGKFQVEPKPSDVEGWLEEAETLRPMVTS